MELGIDSEIVVKIRDAAIRKELRQAKPVDIVRRAERARGEAARKIPSLALAGHAVVAARQLPSGDISLRASNAAAAEVLRTHAAHWAQAFGAGAWVRVPTWGVVVDGVKAHSMNLDTPEQAAARKVELLAQNQHAWGDGAQIAYLSWLVKPRRREGSLVVEFTSPLVANAAISKGTIWQSEIHTNRPYCREGRCRMCMKCQKYGHSHAQCPYEKFTCGTCAAGHPTWECPAKQGQEVIPKCANCGEKHRAISGLCKVRQEAMARAKAAIQSCEAFHRVPEHLRPKQAPTNSATPAAPNAPTTRRSASVEARPISIQLDAQSKPAPAVRIATRPRGRPPKSKSSGDQPLPDMTAQIESAFSVTQSGSQVATEAPSQPQRRSARREAAVAAMMSDPERVFRTTKPTKRVRSLVSKESQQPAASKPKPSQEARPEPELPPALPPITMTMDSNNQPVLDSEASFRELDPERPSEGDYQQLLSRFTNHHSSQNHMVPIREDRSPQADALAEAEAALDEKALVEAEQAEKEARIRKLSMSESEQGSDAMSESESGSEFIEPEESTPRPKQANRYMRMFS